MFGHSIALFGVRRGFKMILSHRAPSSLNMSSYRAIWTHFRPNFIFFAQKYQILVPKSWFWVHKIVFTGGLPPPAVPGGASSPPDPLAGGLQPPVPPCIPRGSASRALRFLLVPRSWKPLTCGYVAARFFPQKKWPPDFWKPLTWGRAHKKIISCGASRVHQELRASF